MKKYLCLMKVHNEFEVSYTGNILLPETLETLETPQEFVNQLDEALDKGIVTTDLPMSLEGLSVSVDPTDTLLFVNGKIKEAVSLSLGLYDIVILMRPMWL